MTAQVHGDESKVVGQVRAELPAPCQPALRKTMDEDDGATRCAPHFHHVERDAPGAHDSMILHDGLPDSASG